MLRRKMEANLAFREAIIQDETDPLIRMNDPFLEVMIPEDEPTIFQGIRFGDDEMIRRQIREGYDVNAKSQGGDYKIKTHSMSHQIHTKGYAVMHLAMLHSTLKVIEELLQAGADLNILDEQNRTPLHFAVVANRISLLNYLILKGADINMRSSSGRTPLLEAVNGGQYDIARILVDAGADLDICDIKGTSVLHHICFDRRPQMSFVRYVLSKKCNVNITNTKGCTPLMFAATFRNLEICKLLVSHGADLNQGDKAGMTPIQFVVEHKTKHCNVLLFFIHNGANVNAVDKKGRSLLDIAMHNMALSTVMCLLLADCNRSSIKVKENEQIVFLCDRLPRFKEWLDSELDSPKSLRRCCRSAIRSHIRPENLKNVSELEIPRFLQDFLLCKDLTAEEVDSLI